MRCYSLIAGAVQLEGLGFRIVTRQAGRGAHLPPHSVALRDAAAL
jgi:hypothetical protein